MERRASAGSEAAMPHGGRRLRTGGGRGEGIQKGKRCKTKQETSWMDAISGAWCGSDHKVWIVHVDLLLLARARFVGGVLTQSAHK